MPGNLLAMDFGGTYLKSGVVSPDGRILHAAMTETPQGASREAYARSLQGCVKDLLRHEPAPAGIGIGSKGVIDPATGRILSLNGPLNALEGATFEELVRPAASCPVRAQNDAVVAALGEGRFGAARGCRHYVVLTLGTGIGAIAVNAGQLVTGSDGIAGAWGHMILDRDGPVCEICQARGCLESLFSATALVERARAALAGGESSTLRPGFKAREIFHAAEAGDALCGRIVSEGVQALAKGVYNAVQTFCPDRLVLSGAMSAAGKALWEPVRRYVDGRVWWTKERLGDRIVPSALGNDAALLGAASLLI